jgi:hypothetical protein
MNPVTGAIVAMLSAGVASGATEVDKKVIVDASMRPKLPSMGTISESPESDFLSASLRLQASRLSGYQS